VPDTCIQDVKKIIDALPKDEGLMLDGKLIRLRLVADYVVTVTNRLECSGSVGNGEGVLPVR
jgi:hypothetical protein